MARNVIVVGAGGGLGRAVAQSLLERGHSVIATVSDEQKVERFRRELPRCADVIAVDLADAERCEEALRGGIARMDRLDAIIVCAAISPMFPAETTTIDTFRRTLEINCVSHLAIYRAAMPALRKS